MNAINQAINGSVFDVITVEMKGMTLTQIHQAVENLMTGSIECVGGGMVLGGNLRDIDVTAANQKEIDDFRKLLTANGFEVVNARNRNAMDLYKKYNDLVWYARSQPENAEMEAVKTHKKRIETAYKSEVNDLRNDYDNWQHGFNSGMYAALGLMLDEDSNMDESNLSLDT